MIGLFGLFRGRQHWSPALSGAEAEMSRSEVVQLRLERTSCQQNITLADRMLGSWRCNSDEIRRPLRRCCRVNPKYSGIAVRQCVGNSSRVGCMQLGMTPCSFAQRLYISFLVVNHTLLAIASQPANLGREITQSNLTMCLPWPSNALSFD
jgi:hypothetical protein